KRELGDYFWQGMYQQRPVPRNAGMAAAGALQIVDLLPDLNHMRLARSWDFAGTPEDGDYTVGTLLAYHEGLDLDFILDVIRVQVSPAEIEERLRRTAEQDTRRTVITIEQEPGSSGKIAAFHYKNNILKGFPVRINRPTGPKFVRAQPLLARIQNG